MNIIEKLESLGKNSIQLEECFSEGRRDLGASRFGGNPDVPPEENPEESPDNWMSPDELFEDITQTDETP